ncbi:glycosyltransferase, partial [bacterium]|nr:glycosyltransferase [bacterium]
YNHGPFIRKALDSILAQTVAAQLEIIVADDCSDDDTLSIVRDIQGEHPDKIVILESKKNMGHTHNYARAWKRATGDFIAHCDGDDYWIDPYKLSKQMDFLLTNPEFSACANKIQVVCDGKVLNESIPQTDRKVFTTEDLLDACYPHNSALFFRNRLFKDLPNFFFELTGHDWCISVMNSLQGRLMIFPESMSVWRIRQDGLWGGRNDGFHLEHTRLFLSHMRTFLPGKFKRVLRKYILRNYFQLAEYYLRGSETQKARLYFACLVGPTAIAIVGWRRFFSLAGRIYFLPIYGLLRSLRNRFLGEPPTA